MNAQNNPEMLDVWLHQFLFYTGRRLWSRMKTFWGTCKTFVKGFKQIHVQLFIYLFWLWHANWGHVHGLNEVLGHRKEFCIEAVALAWLRVASPCIPAWQPGRWMVMWWCHHVTYVLLKFLCQREEKLAMKCWVWVHMRVSISPDCGKHGWLSCLLFFGNKGASCQYDWGWYNQGRSNAGTPFAPS